MVIGLIGKSCSGKNQVAQFLEDHGVIHIDLDKLNHSVIRDNATGLADLFGSSIIDGSGQVDRKALGTIVFSSEKSRATLERFLYPIIESRVEAILEEKKEHPVLLNGAVLHRSDLMKRCNSLIYVSSFTPLRFIRALARDGFRPVAIGKRFANQKDVNPKNFSFSVDTYTMRNNLTRSYLKWHVDRLFSKLTEEKR